MLICPLCRIALAAGDPVCPRDGHAGEPARPANVPEALEAHFGVVELFGQSPGADLFLADDRNNGQRGLLKVQRPGIARELDAQLSLGHDRLAPPLATGFDDGRQWLFREWMEGISLRVMLARTGALRPSDALVIASETATALHELHRAGLVHGDLRPGHILLLPKPVGVPRVWVIDPGLLSARADAAGVSLDDDPAFSDPRYRSPERDARKPVGFRADLYALGCILYEMLSGTPPFVGEDAEALRAAHVGHEPKALDIPLPGAIRALLDQLLAKEPPKRPFSAQKVRRALEPFLPTATGGRREETQTFERPRPAHSTDESGGTLRPPKLGAGAIAPPKSLPNPPKRAAASGARVRPVSVPKPSRPPPAAVEPSSASAAPMRGRRSTSTTPRNVDDSATKLGRVPWADAPPSLVPKAPQGSSPGAVTSGAVAKAAGPAAPDGAIPRTLAPGDPRPDNTPTAPPTLAQTMKELADEDRRAESGPAESGPVETAPSGSGPAEAQAAELGRAESGDGRAVDGRAVDGRAVDGREAPNEGSALDGRAASPAALSSEAAGDAASPPSSPGGDRPPNILAWVRSLSFRHPGPTEVRLMVAVAVAAGMVVIVSVGALVVRQPAALGPVEVAAASTPQHEAPEPSPEAKMPPAPGESQREAAAQAPNREVPNRAPEPIAEAADPPLSTPPGSDATTAARPEAPVPAPPPARTPAPRPAGDEARFEALQERARRLSRQRRYERAEAVYVEALRLRPRRPTILAELGATRMAMGQTRAAVTAYQRAVRLAPRNARFHTALGRAYEAAGAPHRARRSFRRALRLKPDDEDARAGLRRTS